jgi:hypothetical protein
MRWLQGCGASGIIGSPVVTSKGLPVATGGLFPFRRQFFGFVVAFECEANDFAACDRPSSARAKLNALDAATRQFTVNPRAGSVEKRRRFPNAKQHFIAERGPQDGGRIAPFCFGLRGHVVLRSSWLSNVEFTTTAPEAKDGF